MTGSGGSPPARRLLQRPQLVFCLPPLNMHEDSQPPITIFVNTCATVAGAIYRHQAYHTEFPKELIGKNHTICHLEAVNAVAVLKTWAPQLKGCLVHLHTDNAKHAQEKYG